MRGVRFTKARLEYGCHDRAFELPSDDRPVVVAGGNGSGKSTLLEGIVRTLYGFNRRAGDDGYTHDAQCVTYQGPDSERRGREICFAANEDTVTVVDVTDKGAIEMLSRNAYQRFGYTHQGWLTEDHAYFIVDDELDEQRWNHNTKTYTWDMSDLANPTPLRSPRELAATDCPRSRGWPARGRKSG